MKALFKLSLLLGLVIVGKLNQRNAEFAARAGSKPAVATVAAPQLPVVLTGFAKPTPAVGPVRDRRRQHPPAAAPVLGIWFN